MTIQPISLINKMMIVLLFASFTGLSQGLDKMHPDYRVEEWQEMNQSESKQQTMEWFQSAKFGMFIHWGLYSIPGGVWDGKKMEDMKRPWVAEWVQYVAEIPREEYAKLADQFNPVEFNANQIAKLAADAGMKYLVITSKHHDGFAMYDSKVSEFDIVDATPYGKGVLEALYKACKKYGVEFGIYYSHNIDWADGHDCQYSVIKEINDSKGQETRIFGPNLWDPSPNTFEEYLQEKAFPQMEELLLKFPDMKCLWYDMARYMLPEQSFDFYEIAYKHQPQLLVNHRIGNGYGDYIITGDNKIPDEPAKIERPWEVVGTLNNSWGYKSYDDDWKSIEELLYWLVEIVSKGGNYMLNIGPKSTGEIPRQSIKNLQEVGKWIDINGEAIYGTGKWDVTKEGPTSVAMDGTTARQLEGFTTEFTPEDFWFTEKDKSIYAISLKYPESRAVIKSLAGMDFSSVKMLGCGEKLQWKSTDKGLEVIMPDEKPDPHGYVLKIQ